MPKRLPAGCLLNLDASPSLARLRVVEQRARQTFNLHYSHETAQALARRQCTLQLLQAYPDARIEQQSFRYTDSEQGVTCLADYVFCADIAQAGQAQPLAPPQT